MREITKRLADARIVLQAGGEGRRLKSIDESCAKPMLTVGGKPIIERLFEQLATTGFRHFVVITGSSGKAIEQHIASLARDSYRSTDVVFVREKEPLGNAGALSRLDPGAGTTVFVFSDLVTEIDFAALLRKHHERGSDITLASHHEEYKLGLGELITDGDVVETYLEKPTKQFLICSGVAAMEPTALRVASELEPPFGISDLVNAALERSCRVIHWPHGARWLDVNTPEVLQRARAMLAARS